MHSWKLRSRITALGWQWHTQQNFLKSFKHSGEHLKAKTSVDFFQNWSQSFVKLREETSKFWWMNFRDAPKKIRRQLVPLCQKAGITADFSLFLKAFNSLFTLECNVGIFVLFWLSSSLLHVYQMAMMTPQLSSFPSDIDGNTQENKQSIQYFVGNNDFNLFLLQKNNYKK